MPSLVGSEMCIRDSLPTIVRTTEEALIAVPQGYLEGAMALGASKLRVIFSILLPCAMPGIATAIVLAMGRIVGETAALLFTVGVSGFRLPEELFGHITVSYTHLTLPTIYSV